MESIIFMILIAVVGSVLQAAGNKSKQQRQSPREMQEFAPKLQPIVKTNVKPTTVNRSTSMKTTSEPIRKQIVDNFDVGLESDYSFGGVYTEDKRADVQQNQRLYANDTESDAGFVLGDITIEELRRSIIMAEVLGKPKALRRRI